MILFLIRIFLSLLMVLAPALVLAEGEGEGEATVKAAFIFNFFKFIEWPAGAVEEGTLVLCTKGEGAVNKKLMELDHRSLNGKQLSVRQNVEGDALHACNMVYLSNPREYIVTIKELQSFPVVTVGNGNSFINQGGMIGLVPNGNRLGFEVNQELAQTLQIRINSQLLKLATFVKLPK